MPYRVLLRPSAQRQLRKLRGELSVALHGVILALADEPRPRGAIKLSGMRNLWRLRVHIDARTWRVVYLLDEAERLIVVTRVAARDEGTYRKL